MEKKDEEKEEKNEVQKKHLVNKAQRTNLELLCVGKERTRFEGTRQKEEEESQGETICGKVWKMALSSLDFGAVLVVYRCCSREAGARKEKRKCRKSLSCRMRWKALPWTKRAKAFRRSR